MDMQTPFRIQSTGDRIMEKQLKRRKEQSRGKTKSNKKANADRKPITTPSVPATAISLGQPVLSLDGLDAHDCPDYCEQDGEQSPFFAAYNVSPTEGRQEWSL